MTRRRTMRWGLAMTPLLLTACAAPAPPVATQPQASVGVPGRARERARARGLYTPTEALDDVLAGELTYLGTGRWPGIERSRACVFRNDRVLVVNVYCTRTETHAFRIDVYSPERGRLRIYAEADGPVSARVRADYFTFTAESEPPPGAQARLPSLSLSMSFEQLRRYEAQRYQAYLPSCYGGERHGQRRGGCLDALAPRARQWSAQTRDFLQHADRDWYRVVDRMRSLAARYGTDPD